MWACGAGGRECLLLWGEMEEKDGRQFRSARVCLLYVSACPCMYTCTQRSYEPACIPGVHVEVWRYECNQDRAGERESVKERNSQTGRGEDVDAIRTHEKTLPCSWLFFNVWRFAGAGKRLAVRVPLNAYTKGYVYTPR